MILTLVLYLGFAFRAWADTPGMDERAARKACLSGDYKKGVEILSDLFINTDNPVHIYNQGRCFEQNGRCDEAINRFREYLRKAKNLGPGDTAEVGKHVAECEVLLTQKPTPSPESKPEMTPGPKSELEARPEAVPAPKHAAEIAPKVVPPLPAEAIAPPPPPVVTPVPPSSVAATTTTDQLVANPPAPAPGSGQGLRIAGIACGVAGAGAIGAAIYFYTRARSLSDKVSGQKVHSQSDVQAGKDAETMQWVFYSIGGAALGTGLLLYALGWRTADGGQPRVANVGPMLGPGMAGLSAQGAF